MALSGAVLLVLAVVPLAIGALATALGSRAGRRLSPAAATVLLTMLALTVSLVTGLLLCLAAVVALAEVAPLSGLGHWSPDTVRARVPIPPVLGLAGGMVAAVLLGSACAYLLRVIRGVRYTSATAAAAPAVGDLVVVQDQLAFAYAIPGRHHRIVASTGMLRGLTAPQRRVLLAHEAAHLRHHHHLYVQLGRIAAAANPLMRPVSQAIDLAVERWADESAAREVGDRRTAARALVAASLVQPVAPSPAGSLAGAGTHVLERVTGLLSPPAPHRLLAVGVAAVVLGCWIAGGLVIGDIHGLMELSEKIRRH